jgi:hypothetical protein
MEAAILHQIEELADADDDVTADPAPADRPEAVAPDGNGRNGAGGAKGRTNGA